MGQYFATGGIFKNSGMRRRKDITHLDNEKHVPSKTDVKNILRLILRLCDHVDIFNVSTSWISLTGIYEKILWVIYHYIVIS